MKNQLLIFVSCLILITTSSYCQDDSKIDVGISTGVINTYSLFEGDLASRTNSSVTFSYSLDFYYDLSDRTQVKTGVSFEKYSYGTMDYSSTFPSDFVNGNVNLFKSVLISQLDISFVTIPAEVKYKLKGGVNHIYAIGGIRPKFLVGNNSTHSFFTCDDFIASESSEINSFLLDLSIGVGYEFKFGSTK